MKSFFTLSLFVLLGCIGPSLLHAESSTIRGDGTLVIDGKPVFPIGFRAESLAHVKEGASCGFNLVQGSGEWERPQYDYAAMKDLWIIGGDCYVHFIGPQPGINLAAREDAVLNNFYAKTKDQHERTIRESLEGFAKLPKVIGWGLGDEPEAKLTEQAEAAYEIIKSYIPNKIVMNISCDVRWVPCFLNTADVLVYDRYLLRGTPRKNNEGYSASQNTLTDNLDHVIKIWSGKSCWYMPQLYHPSYFSMKPEELLTLKDLREQCYLALQCGVKGLLFYTWDALHLTYGTNEKGERTEITLTDEQFNEQMQNMRCLTAELKKLEAVLCDGRPSREVFVNWLAPGPMGPGSQRIRILDYYGKQYLILHNPLNEPMKGVALGPDLGHANFAKTFTGKVITGKEDITLSRHPKGMVQFTIVPHGCGVVELTRTNLLDRLGK